VLCVLDLISGVVLKSCINKEYQPISGRLGLIGNQEITRINKSLSWQYQFPKLMSHMGALIQIQYPINSALKNSFQAIKHSSIGKTITNNRFQLFTANRRQRCIRIHSVFLFGLFKSPDIPEMCISTNTNYMRIHLHQVTKAWTKGERCVKLQR